MKRTAKYLSLAALALGLSGGVALAQQGQAMRALDTNGDGLLQRSEMEAAVAARFARLDANHDGVVTLEEMQARVAPAFAAIDSNGDGALSRAEMRAKANEARALIGGQ